MGDSYPDNLPARPSGRGAAPPKSATPPAFSPGSPANPRRGNTLRLFIGREAGIGKTTLATFIEYEAHGRGIREWVVHCYELAATLPYGPCTGYAHC
jgi:hypothetical protein